MTDQSSEEAWADFLETLTPTTRRMLQPAIADIEAPECKWHFLKFVDGEHPVVQEFGELGSLRRAIMRDWPSMKILAEDVIFHVFFGVKAMFSTHNGQPYLLHPVTGEMISLFDEEEPVKLIDDGTINRREVVEVTEAVPDEDAGYDGVTIEAEWSEAEVGSDLSPSPTEQEPMGDSEEYDSVSEEEPPS